MKKPAHIVVVGSLNMDLVIQAPRHPMPGETLTGGPFITVPGGKGANQAVAAARLGGTVTMIGKVGADAFGDALLANLNKAGVTTSEIGRADVATGVALITVSAAGENTIVIAPGANGTLTPDDIRSRKEIIAGADALLLQLEVPLPTVEAAAQIAQANGVPVILNPAPARSLPSSLLARVTYLIPNEHEAALLVGDQPGGLPTGTLNRRHDPEMLARMLLGTGVQTVILTLGAAGALVHDQGGAARVLSFPISVVDSTAAGDAFAAAFAVALCEGKNPVDAAAWGCAAGGLACTVLGAQPSLPGREAVERLVETR
jgi:ribokinase